MSKHESGASIGLISMPAIYTFLTQSVNIEKLFYQDTSVMAVLSLFTFRNEEFFEGFSKFGVEDRIDGRVKEAVHVAEPDEEGEDKRIYVADLAAVEVVVAQADGVEDVDREERHPAEEKHTWTCNRISVSAYSGKHVWTRAPG